MRIHQLASTLLFLVLCVPASSEAAPVDARVGQTRATYLKQGTALRAQPSALGAAAATLTTGTQIRIDEVKLPWLRVTALNGSGTGWLRAFETVEAHALARPTAPARVSGGGGVSGRDVTAAGRQLDAGTEQGFKRSRQDLRVAYMQVDHVEAATHAIDPADAIQFIVEGRLGRRGRDYARPAMLPPTPAPRGRSRARNNRPQRTRNRNPLGKVGNLLGGLGGSVGKDVGKVLGGKEGRAAGQLIEGFAEQKRQLSQKFTPDQEYYLGRAVAASAIAKYGLDTDPARAAYVRLVGEAVVRLSNRVRPNYGGYHFAVLNSDEINGVSGPGGFVLLTRGAVNACQTEAELAGIICHELAHVTQGHGERVLRQGKSFQSALGGLTQAGSTMLGVKGNVQQHLVQFFGKVVGEVSRTAIETGYGSNLEFAADTEGTNLLFDVYYEQNALQLYLQRMPGHHHGHAGTHAAPAVRAQALSGAIARLPNFSVQPQISARRAQRFQSRTGVAIPR